MADIDALLIEARQASADRRWADAHAGFVAAREVEALHADDLAALGEAAWWRGDIDECLAAMEEAYRQYVAMDDSAQRTAARLAMEIGYFWYLRADEAIASGWFGRARRLLEPYPDSVEHGYLLSTAIDDALAEGDLETAAQVAAEVLDLSRRTGDETLAALALVGAGIAAARQGDVAQGLAILDEAMLPVVEGRVQAAYAGNIYCQLMQVCHDLADVRRARQWTDATMRWCEGFESAVMFVGICRVHRAQLLLGSGEWQRAEAEALDVCEQLSTMNTSAVAEASYQLAEVRRLRGDLASADEAYRQAHLKGRDPQPGLALLRLAEGQVDAAARSIGAAVRTTSDPLSLAPLWAAQVEIGLQAGDRQAARRAADALDKTAEVYGSSGLRADATQARGMVATADGDTDVAMRQLTSAIRQWQGLGSPYRAARVRVWLAQAYRAAGEVDAADAELDAAAAAFEALHARVDVDRVAGLRLAVGPPAGLTRREADVLRVVATGRSNREAAEALVLSEKTVARHLHNIYAKLGVSSRTAAAAFAFQHGLVDEPPTDLHRSV